MATKRYVRKTPPGSKVGRPPKEIDANEVERLAGIGCTNTEIAQFFGVDETTIRRRFADVITKGRSGGKIRLRSLQHRRAAQGSDRMLIWLGKQELGQRDRLDTTVTDVAAVASAESIPEADKLAALAKIRKVLAASDDVTTTGESVNADESA